MASQTDTVIKFDETFYLRHKNGQYLTFAQKEGWGTKRHFPKLSSNKPVKLQLKGKGKNKTHNLTNGDRVKIHSLEGSLGGYDILGAFADKHNCYYWKDGYDDAKQGWQIHKVSGYRVNAISDGDEVYFTNLSYSNQRLAADTKYPGYITTKKNSTETWIVESVHKKQQQQKQPQKQPVVESNTKNPASVFGLSIASADPSNTGVILWTRINPDKYDSKESLKYEVCENKQFSEGVIKGEVEASNFSEKRDYTVHVDLHGRLEAGKTYYYRFLYKGIYSKIGRCKTLRAADDKTNLRLAVVTCNDYSTGYFNAFYHLAEENIDFVIHVGDFIYEYSQYPPGYGKVFRKDIKLTDDKYKQTADSKRTTSLKDFRYIYRTYREDLALQAAMEQHTWIITLDDHEVADNWYWDYQHNTIDVGSDHPVFGKTTEEKTNLYNNAIQAWREYVPARLKKAENVNKDTEPHEYQIYRHFRFGSLVDFFLTDSRSYRSKPEADPLKQSSDATMLGVNQKKWLIDGVTKSNATWQVWGNQTLLATAQANVEIANLKGEPELIDDWQAYMRERGDILEAVKKSQTDNKSHFVVFTGDMHTSMISELKTDVNDHNSKAVGVELMTPSLTSPGVLEGAREAITRFTGNSILGWVEDLIGGSSTESEMLSEFNKGMSPHIKHYDSTIYGYAIAQFTPNELTWEVYNVDKKACEEVDGRDISKKGVNLKSCKVRAEYNPNNIELTVQD